MKRTPSIILGITFILLIPFITSAQDKFTDFLRKELHAHMDELKKQIIYLNELTNKSRNLKKIEQVKLGVASAKGIFKHLVKYPEAITHFSDFLYHKVPEMLRASERFLSIKEDKLSTEEITLATNGILSTIRVLSESITDDYEKLVSEASEEISLSKKLVERKNG